MPTLKLDTMLSKKIVITGHINVGKTSLFMRFLQNEFSDRYHTTIGVKVDKKTVDIDGQEVSLVLWDLAGEVSQEKVPRAYFLGASCIIFVYDLTRPVTHEKIKADIKFINKILPGCLIKIVGNKSDLLTEEELTKNKTALPTDIYTSAKTGENVESLFMDIGRELIS